MNNKCNMNILCHLTHTFFLISLKIPLAFFNLNDKSSESTMEPLKKGNVCSFQ